MRPLTIILLTLIMAMAALGQTYTINTVAGGGSSLGDNGPAIDAQLNFPVAVALDSAGNVYIADDGYPRIRKVSNGVITTIAGTGTPGFSGDNGLAANALLSSPKAIAVDSAGNLYIADSGNNRIRKVSNGVITTIAGGGSSVGDQIPATNALLSGPWGIAVDSAGNLYIADSGNNRIRKVSNGVITTIAGTGTPGFSGDNGPATSAEMYVPAGLAVDSTGALYIADLGNQRIREVSQGIITTVAGGGSSLPGDDGPATSAWLNFTWGGLSLDPARNLYIADDGNDRIQRVSIGIITTVAGNGVCCDISLGDNGPATGATLQSPDGVAVDSAGNIYVADSGNNRIRALVPSGPSCAYSVAPASLQAPPSGGNLTVSIQTTVACPWLVSGLPNWVTISGASNGIGAATLTFLVPPNSGFNLSATILIAGVAVTITQSTAPPAVITAVVNAASFQNGPISPGEIVTLGGTGLGPSAPAGLALDQTGKVSTSISGVQVLFSGTAAPLAYVSATQINAVVPYEIQGLLSPSVQVKYQGQSSNALPLSPASAVPALFTFNGSGTGPAAALNQDNTYNAPNNPAPKGSYIVLYVTGEGQTSPLGVTGKVTTVSATPPVTPQPVLPVTVLIGGQPALVAFYGEAPGLISGVMQLNVQIPANAPSGSIPVSIFVGGNSSQSGVTVSVQ